MEVIGTTTKNLKSLKRNLSNSIIGVSFKKMPSAEEDDRESECFDDIPHESPTKRIRTSRRQTLGGNLTDMTNHLREDAFNKVQVVRTAFGSMRQKLRNSTRRRRQLFDMSTPSPYKGQRGNSRSRGNFTPIRENRENTMTCRRSPRLNGESPDISDTVSMYSLTIDTPSKPPRIRMGTKGGKRLYDGTKLTPRTKLKRDMETVNDALRLLNYNADQICGVLDKQGCGIITTPGGRPKNSGAKSQE